VPGARARDLAALLGMWHQQAGSRESQAVFACKNPDCGWSDNSDTNAARNILYLYRTGHALAPACRKEQSSGAATRQVHHRKVGGKSPPFTGRRLQESRQD